MYKGSGFKFRIKMASFVYSADYSKGATDMFQLSTLELDDVDVINRVDQGVHLQDEKHLIQYFAVVFSIPVEEITVEKV